MDLPRNGREWAARCRALLHRFHNGRDDWALRAIERVSNGEVKQQYLSQLLAGKFENPGVAKLAGISEVLGAPYLLWFLSPERWDEALNLAVVAELDDVWAYLEPEDVRVVVGVARHLADLRRQLPLSTKQQNLLEQTKQ